VALKRSNAWGGRACSARARGRAACHLILAAAGRLRHSRTIVIALEWSRAAASSQADSRTLTRASPRRTHLLLASTARAQSAAANSGASSSARSAENSRAQLSPLPPLLGARRTCWLISLSFIIRSDRLDSAEGIRDSRESRSSIAIPTVPVRVCAPPARSFSLAVANRSAILAGWIKAGALANQQEAKFNYRQWSELLQNELVGEEPSANENPHLAKRRRQQQQQTH
jgi:hypothetical protein